MKPTDDVEACPRGKQSQPDANCTNRAQCWEPCGELGNDEKHARLADASGSAGVGAPSAEARQGGNE